MPDIVLRGAVYSSGGLQSFYVKNDQRNLIALLFELPKGRIKKNDIWSVDVHFISMDNNFKCDSSYHKNCVKLIDIKKENGETVAVLNYDLQEFVTGDFMSPYAENKKVKTVMKMTFNGMAKFSVDKGRWINYSGLLSLKSSGAMNSNMLKIVSLIPK